MDKPTTTDTFHLPLSMHNKNVLIIFKSLNIIGLVLFFIFFKNNTITAQSSTNLENETAAAKLGMKDFKDAPRGDTCVRVMFYNCENFFNPENDSLTNDEDFTPTGVNAWSFQRYNKKISQLYKVITSLGGWETPDMMGFCEVENRTCLEDLLSRSPLKKEDYAIVHQNSPDRRGIDVAFVYKKDKFKYLAHQAIFVQFPFDPDARTRDILYVKGIVLGKDTLHVFVNHWPSRLGGQTASEPRRDYVAKLVRHKVDSILTINKLANILIMGDFNDEPEDMSIAEVLRAKGDLSSDLFNYMYAIKKGSWKIGSHKYREQWGILDQIIVSKALTTRRSAGLIADPLGAHIFAADFLLQNDETNFGLQPIRTFVGPKYNPNGFSDHLPVYVDLFVHD